MLNLDGLKNRMLIRFSTLKLFFSLIEKNTFYFLEKFLASDK